MMCMCVCVCVKYFEPLGNVHWVMIPFRVLLTMSIYTKLSLLLLQENVRASTMVHSLFQEYIVYYIRAYSTLNDFKIHIHVGHFPEPHTITDNKVNSHNYCSEIVPRDSFILSKFSKTSSMSLRMVSTSQGSGGIKEATSGEMTGVLVNRVRDCSGESPMALPNIHSQRMLWNCNGRKNAKMNYAPCVPACTNYSCRLLYL